MNKLAKQMVVQDCRITTRIISWMTILHGNLQDCFEFTDNFLRVRLPATDQVTDQVRSLITLLEKECNRTQLMQLLGLSHNDTFRRNYLHPAIELGLIEMTIPDKPKSSNQKYRLTKKGAKLKKIHTTRQKMNV